MAIASIMFVDVYVSSCGPLFAAPTSTDSFTITYNRKYPTQTLGVSETKIEKLSVVLNHGNRCNGGTRQLAARAPQLEEEQNEENCSIEAFSLYSLDTDPTKIWHQSLIICRQGFSWMTLITKTNS